MNLLHSDTELQKARAHWGGQRDLWVFGYASLIWRPEFEAAERRPALLRGWHRALAMRSGINRGTPERPGLVCALVSGGSCRGVVYRVERERGDVELQRLWAREMPDGDKPGGAYDPRWLRCRTAEGTVEALAFTLSRHSPSHLGVVDDEHLVDVLRHARGRFGTTLEYLVETAASLRRCGIHDRELERLVALARRHALG